MKKKQISLNHLKIGKTAIVTKLDTIGPMRRRMLDLGIINGTKIKAIYQSPLKDPTAYFVRGTVIALRKEDAQQIQVIELEESKWD